MATKSDLYRDTLKDSDRLLRSNPRSKSGLSSNDFEYKNYLHGMKPRDKSNSIGSRAEANNKAKEKFLQNNNRPKFVEKIATSSTLKENGLKHASPVNSKKLNNDGELKGSTSKEPEAIVGVSKLRSLFDSHEKGVVFRNSGNANRANRPASMNDIQSLGNQNAILGNKSLDVNKIVSANDSTKIEHAFKKDDSWKKTTNETVGEPENVRIDVDLLLAPIESEGKQNTKTNVIEPSSEESKSLALDKTLEVNRLKRAEEEINSEKHFRRRSLKERLNDILTEEEKEASKKRQSKDITQKDIVENSIDPTRSETSQYVSAVDRFDNFVKTEKNNIDRNKNFINLSDGEELKTVSETDIQAHYVGKNDSKLMDSILEHLEHSEAGNGLNDKDISMLRDSSQDHTEVEENEILSEKQEDVHTKPMYSDIVYARQDTMEYETESEGSNEEVSEEITDTLPTLKPILSQNKNGGVKKNVSFRDKKIANTIVTYGPEEYDRANADIDPIASSAEWELEKRVDKMDIFSVDLQKDSRGLGLSIIGLGVGTETGVEKLGIFVKTLTENGASQKDGRIQVNDQILEVNGVSLVGVTQYFAAQTLKGTNGTVRFLMGREKTRRTQYSPGAPIAESPGMQRHIQDMNNVLQQMEEVEDRAVHAENTIDEIKVELLKAEERAHTAEQLLSETKEQLNAFKESPFVSGNRKMKNEIKNKKNVKSDGKIDELQRHLKDVTNRLSASEDNLLQLSFNAGNKDGEIKEMERKIEEGIEKNSQLQESNEKIGKELSMAVEELRNAKMNQEKLEEKLKKLKKEIQVERAEFSMKEKDYNIQSQKVEQAFNSQYEEILNENKTLKEQIQELTVDQKNSVSNELVNLKEQLTGYESLKALIESVKSELEDSQSLAELQVNEIQALKGRNEKLSMNIKELEVSKEEMMKEQEKLHKDELQKHAETEQQLKEQISILEGKFEKPKKFFDNIFVEEKNSTAVNVAVVESEKQNDIDDSTQLPVLEEDFIISQQTEQEHMPDVEMQSKDVVRPENAPVVKSASDNFITLVNPVTKPPRSKTDINAITKNDVKPEDTGLSNVVNDVQPVDSLNLDIVSSNISADQNEKEKLDNSALVHQVSDSVLANAIIEASHKLSQPQEIEMTFHEGIERLNSISPCTNPKDLFLAMPSDFDQLKEDNVDSEESGDKGKFLIIAEDVEEELMSPKAQFADPLDGVSSRESTLNWSGSHLSNLNTLDKEKEADLIAAQIVDRSPVKRTPSSSSSIHSSSGDEDDSSSKLFLSATSTSLGEEMDRKASLKIDSSYFEKSTMNESIDYEVSVLDDDLEAKQEAKKNEKEKESDVKDSVPSNDVERSESFSVIPYTVVLNNQFQHDKRQLKTPEKRKPTRGAKGELAKVEDDFQIRSETLPLSQKLSSNSQKIAASMPNLSDNPDKKSSKSKFGFHIPKVFKKSKMGSKVFSHENLSHGKGGGAGAEPHDTEVVPLKDKMLTFEQEKVNDAATEEAVVPFADQEMLMSTEVKSSGKTSTLNADINVEPLKINERAIDVGNSESPVEAGHAHWTGRNPSDWDVRLVGLWLVEANLGQYVNNFKSHNVDGQTLLRADGHALKEYGVSNTEHRAEIKRRTKEFRQKLGKDSFNRGKNRDYKSGKGKLQFWKGKYKVTN